MLKAYILNYFQEITSYAVLTGVGGVYDCEFPWSTWRKSGWFEAAICIVSLSIRHMDRLIPGYRNFEQSLQNDYIGNSHRCLLGYQTVTVLASLPQNFKAY